MKKAAGVSVAALSMMSLLFVEGCTRASDGSFELRKSTMLGRALNSGDDAAEAPQPVDAPVYTEAGPPPSYRRTQPRLPRVSVPTMSISQNPPFRRADPDKPLTCHNETSPSGRVRVVCI